MNHFYLPLVLTVKRYFNHRLRTTINHNQPTTAAGLGHGAHVAQKVGPGNWRRAGEAGAALFQQTSYDWISQR